MIVIFFISIPFALRCRGAPAVPGRSPRKGASLTAAE
jgi:hypothetical protein